MSSRAIGLVCVACLPLLAVTSAGADTAPSVATAQPGWPERLYGDGAEYTILRNGKPVGQHLLRFRRDRGDLVVNARSDIAVRLLGIPVYRFEYRSRSIWRDGRLEQITATRTENGDRQQVDARRQSDRLVVTGPAGQSVADGATFPTNHWHPGVLQSQTVLNTLTGALDRVQIEPIAADGEGAGSVRRFVYSGDLRVEVWYDRDWRWTRLRFAAKDGSEIEYVCTSCERLAAAGE